MQVLRSGWQLPHIGVQSASAATPEARSTVELARDERRSEFIRARASIASTDLSFAVAPGNNSITVTLADRVSGEVFRKLVYDFSGTLQDNKHANTGLMLDVGA